MNSRNPELPILWTQLNLLGRGGPHLLALTNPGTDPSLQGNSSGSPILQQTTSRQALAFSTSVLERALPGMPRIYQPIGTVSYSFLPSDIPFGPLGPSLPALQRPQKKK